MKRRAALFGLAVLPGCGYALVGRGISTPTDIKKIGVPIFVDRTGKATLDQKVTQYVSEELLKRGNFDVVPTAAGVDARVEGELLTYSASPVAFTADAVGVAAAPAQASRYAITVTAKVRYMKTGQDEPIWENPSFSYRDEYDVGSDAAGFFNREEQAIERLSQQFARSLVAAMLEAF